MEDYNFWADFFDTYQSLSDWVKILWLIVPPAFLLGFVALILHYRLAAKKRQDMIEGDLIYTVHRDDLGRYLVQQHGSGLENELTLLIFSQNKSQPQKPEIL